MRVISGVAKGTVLKTPAGMKTRPTTDRVKEALFSIIQFDIPNARVLDLFGGTGQLGIEALSRGSESAVFVDERKEACDLIKINVVKSGFEDKTSIIRSDYLSYLRNCREKFDIILLDPPYAEVYLENAVKMIKEIDILRTNGIMVCERPNGKELPYDESIFERSKDYKYGSTLLAVLRKK